MAKLKEAKGEQNFSNLENKLDNHSQQRIEMKGKWYRSGSP